MASNVVTFTHTAVNDLAFKLTIKDLWIKDGNFHIATQNANYGDRNTQAVTVTTAQVLSFESFNLNDIFFRNATGGLNTTVYFIGILMTEGEKEAKGLV